MEPALDRRFFHTPVGADGHAHGARCAAFAGSGE
jgi:hypothetical protein